MRNSIPPSTEAVKPFSTAHTLHNIVQRCLQRCLPPKVPVFAFNICVHLTLLVVYSGWTAGGPVLQPLLFRLPDGFQNFWQPLLAVFDLKVLPCHGGRHLRHVAVFAKNPGIDRPKALA